MIKDDAELEKRYQTILELEVLFDLLISGREPLRRLELIATIKDKIQEQKRALEMRIQFELDEPVI